MPETPAPKTPKPVWYEAGLSFSCSLCGDCCSGPPGFVWFDEAEAGVMADKLGLSMFEFLSTYAERQMGRWTLRNVRRPHGEYDCVFLKEIPDMPGKRGCQLYESRPTQCKTWPFWPSNLHSEKAWKETARRCTGMREGGLSKEDAPAKGKFYSLDQIRVTLSSNPEHMKDF